MARNTSESDDETAKFFGAYATRVFPSVVLDGMLQVAFKKTTLLLAAIAVALTPIGWRLSAAIFLRDLDPIGLEFADFMTHASAPAAPPTRPLVSLPPAVPENPTVTPSEVTVGSLATKLPTASPAWRSDTLSGKASSGNAPAGDVPTGNALSTSLKRPVGFDGLSMDGYVTHARRLVTEPISEGIGRPFRHVFGALNRLFSSEPHRFRHWLYLVSGLGWTVAIWILCGGLIARQSVVYLGLGQDSSLIDDFRFVLARWKTLVWLPKVPVLAFAGITAAGWIMGYLLRSNWSAFFVGIGWPALLTLGWFATTLAILAVPMFLFMITAAVTEKACNETEAFHRAFSYATQRKFALLLYVAVAAAIGTGGALVIDCLMDLLLRFTGWMVGLGMSAERFNELLAADSDSSPIYAARIIGVFEWLTALMTDGFRFAFIFSTGAALYLQLRLDVDEMEFDEVDEPDQLPNAAPDPIRKQLDELAAGKRDDE